MIAKKGGAPKLAPEQKRVKIAPAMTREAIEALRMITKRTGESQSDVLIRLIWKEYKRLKF